jgi:hypothetical protein
LVVALTAFFTWQEHLFMSASPDTFNDSLTYSTNCPGASDMNLNEIEISLLLLPIFFTWQELILIFFLSDEIKRLHLEVLNALHAEYQGDGFATPSVSAAEYTLEEIR